MWEHHTTPTTTVLPEMLTRLLWWVTRLLMLCALGTCHERPQREPPKFTNALDWLLITEGVSHLHALPDVGQTKRGERMRMASAMGRLLAACASLAPGESYPIADVAKRPHSFSVCSACSVVKFCSATGSVKLKSAPPPARSSTEMAPPCASTSARTMARPSPVPPVAAAREGSARKKRSKMRSRSSAGTPGPESATLSRTSCPVRAADTSMCPPGGV